MKDLPNHMSEQEVSGESVQKKFLMSSKGVNSNTIDGIIYSKEIDWMKILEKEYKKKYKSNADFSLNEISKAKKFFLQRGFNIELINEFFKR